jgi:hypothetical protein
MKKEQLKDLIKEEIRKVLNENNFNPPGTPASPGGNATPEDYLKFYEGQYQALSNRMKEAMDNPSIQRLLNMPNSWEKMPQFIKELSNYMDMYDAAIKYTKKYIKLKDNDIA